jgi:light-regulated signal transduction histidine kinase (bacteriophytochrome)
MDESFRILASVLLQVGAVLAQLTALYVALRLIRITGRSPAWILISVGFGIMALRRSISLALVFTGASPPDLSDLWDESTALLISATMLAGVLSISPLFRTIKEAAEVLLRDKNELESQVKSRTEELREANARLSVELDERRRAELKLAQYTGDLTRSNAELEQFAYVASHDLQEPLRMVASFTQLLARRYQGKLDQNADEFIGFAVDGANRMQQLINDLLAYSRVGTRGKPLAPTDLTEVLGHARANLHEAIKESGALVTNDPLPMVMGDEVQLTQLFQNLLANAIKFQGQKTPLIHVSAQTDEHGWRLAVKDNGIGIAPEHQERIFAIFQRLHGRQEYPGTGIGLALCKKIVERHGGRIWLQSEPGKGAIFYFNLPGERKDDRKTGELPLH